VSVEVELKMALVSADRLPALLDALPAPSAVVEQRNHYFVADQPMDADTPPAMVRVRESYRVSAGGELTREAITLTVKRRTKEADSGLFVAEEHEQPVPPDFWAAVGRGEATVDEADGPALAWLRGQGRLGTLRRQGAMRNRRHVVAFDGFTLEVDRTEFPDGSVDAEVEVETDDPEGARAVVTRAAEAAGVALREQTMTKYNRFLSRGGASG